MILGNRPQLIVEVMGLEQSQRFVFASTKVRFVFVFYEPNLLMLPTPTEQESANRREPHYVSSFPLPCHSYAHPSCARWLPGQDRSVMV